MQYLLNGLLLIIPVFIFNAVLYSRLPEFYQPACWDRIPKPLDVAENIFRFVVFLLPILLKLDITPQFSRLGMGLYLIGLIVYFLSWWVQIKYQGKGFNRRLAFRAAPAYTTILWLVGIGLLCPVSFIRGLDVRLLYLICVGLFVIIHTTHAVLVYKAQNPDNGGTGHNGPHSSNSKPKSKSSAIIWMQINIYISEPLFTTGIT